MVESKYSSKNFEKNLFFFIWQYRFFIIYSNSPVKYPVKHTAVLEWRDVKTNHLIRFS